jgi:hypothetical protein
VGDFAVVQSNVGVADRATLAVLMSGGGGEILLGALKLAVRQLKRNSDNLGSEGITPAQGKRPQPGAAFSIRNWRDLLSQRA